MASDAILCVYDQLLPLIRILPEHIRQSCLYPFLKFHGMQDHYIIAERENLLL